MEEDGGRAYCESDLDAAARLERDYRGVAVQSALAKIRESPGRYHVLADSRSVTFAANGDEVQMDFEALPPALKDFLGTVNREFRSTFGRVIGSSWSTR